MDNFDSKLSLILDDYTVSVFEEPIISEDEDIVGRRMAIIDKRRALYQDVSRFQDNVKLLKLYRSQAIRYGLEDDFNNIVRLVTRRQITRDDPLTPNELHDILQKLEKEMPEKINTARIALEEVLDEINPNGVDVTRPIYLLNNKILLHPELPLHENYQNVVSYYIRKINQLAGKVASLRKKKDKSESDKRAIKSYTADIESMRDVISSISRNYKANISIIKDNIEDNEASYAIYTDGVIKKLAGHYAIWNAVHDRIAPRGQARRTSDRVDDNKDLFIKASPLEQ